MLRFGLFIGFFLFVFHFIRDYSPQTGPIEVEDDYKTASLKKIQRSPASVVNKPVARVVPTYRPGIRESAKDDKNFAREILPEVMERREPVYSGGYRGMSSVSESPGRFNNKTTDGKRTERGQTTKTDPSSDSFSRLVQGPFMISGPVDSGSLIPKDTPKSTSSTYDGLSLTCSSNQGAGTYGSPILVSLECSSASEIKYCLSEGACCDPYQSGIVYTAPIIVAPTDGQFCLSFIGEMSSGKTSSLTELTYAITSGAPELQTGHPKIFYQTTELAGTSYLTSTDFGRANYGIGQVNLRSFDPGANGCEYLYDNYVIAAPPPPVPYELLAFLDLVTVNPGSQLEVPLLNDTLDYGDNFVFSYLVDNSEAIPEYACSTTKVTLYDFDYFQLEASNGETGTNTVREFSGGFSPYGFFETDSMVYRGPAGVSGEEKSGQRLESGLFEIFF